MKPSFSVAIALALLPLQSAYAQGGKRDILGVSLGMPLPEIAKRDMIASAGEWKPQQEKLVQVGDYTCKKLRAPWTLSSGELFCGVDGPSQLLLDVALRTEPPTIQSITYNFCSTEESFRVSERVYQEYRITNGLKEMNPVVWGPDYKLDSRTTLNIGYSGQPCSEGRGYELKLHDYHIRRVNSKNWQEQFRQTASRRKRKS